MKQPLLSHMSSERRFQLLVEAVADYAIYLIEGDGTVSTWNAGAERITGYTSAEVLGRDVSMFSTKEDRAAGRPLQSLDAARTTGRFAEEGWRLRKDDTPFWASFVLHAVRDETEAVVGFAAVTRDMTERRAAQRALRDSERQFRLLTESLTDYAIFMLDLDGLVTNWNSGAHRITGYASDEIIGQHVSRFFIREEKDAELPMKALRTAREEGKYQAEGLRQRKDGTRFWASVVIDPVYDENGALIGYAKVTRDIQEYHEAQIKLEQAREDLFQAQKMEAVGQLTGGVAHDFNNLLTVIVSGADLAERHIGDNPKLARLIGNMRQAALRGEALTKQLLAFSRRQPLRPATIDVGRQLRLTVDLLKRSLRGDIEIVANVSDDLWTVNVDPSQLDLSMLNVGLNARDAMPSGGRIEIKARNMALNSNEMGLQGDFVAVSLRDSGLGMSDDVKARAFEPFFTTKDVGRGSGLGLSQAYGFARQSGGALLLESEPGQGTVVTFYLPVSRAPVETPYVAPAPTKPAATIGGRILLVEDDPAVRELTTGILEASGYEVKAAAAAMPALDILRGGEKIDLMFSDIMMPGGMNGAELARDVREEFPHIFILLATGYAEAAASTLAMEFPLIRKPYRETALLEQIAQILGG